MRKEFKIYVDMDGVLADFDMHFESLFKVNPHEFKQMHGAEAFWKKIYSVENYFKNLPLFPETKWFWGEICNLSPHVIILSSPSKQNTESCVNQKMLWVKEHLSDDAGFCPGMIFESKKFKYAGENCILIDDTLHKIQPWSDAGGIGILHVNDHKRTIEVLKKRIADGREEYRVATSNSGGGQETEVRVPSKN